MGCASCGSVCTAAATPCGSAEWRSTASSQSASCLALGNEP